MCNENWKIQSGFIVHLKFLRVEEQALLLLLVAPSSSSFSSWLDFHQLCLAVSLRVVHALQHLWRRSPVSSSSATRCASLLPLVYLTLLGHLFLCLGNVVSR